MTQKWLHFPLKIFKQFSGSNFRYPKCDLPREFFADLFHWLTTLLHRVLKTGVRNADRMAADGGWRMADGG